MRWLYLAALLCLVAVTADATPKTARPPDDSDATLITAVDGLARTQSWPVAATTTGVDVWATAPAPFDTGAGSAAARAGVRFVYVTHSDATDAAIPVCLRLGPTTNTPTLSCVAGSQNGIPLQGQGSGYSLTTRQPIYEATTANASVPVWLVAQSGTVDVVVTVGW